MNRVNDQPIKPTDDTTLQAKAEMLIRRPVAEVFEAFVNPEITTQIRLNLVGDRFPSGIGSG
jgi:hypothetical protein